MGMVLALFLSHMDLKLAVVGLSVSFGRQPTKCKDINLIALI
ncbi:hypothetical protein SynM161_02397 [Synechococcus sp. M16.1]|nr:hypothetical protein SynM161_02397 [Synechococcus sp. M16.1]